MESYGVVNKNRHHPLPIGTSASLLGARMLLGAPGIATSNKCIAISHKKLLVQTCPNYIIVGSFFHRLSDVNCSGAFGGSVPTGEATGPCDRRKKGCAKA